MNIVYHKTLYVRGIGTKIKEWSIKVVEENNQVNMIVAYGDVNGKKAEKITKIKQGKNIGKSNETSVIQQAINNAKGKLLKKEREGYKFLEDIIKNTDYKDYTFDQISPILENLLQSTLPEISTDKEGYEKPMKAQPYFKDDGITPRISFPCYGQPKINGFRCTVHISIGKTDLFGNNINVVYKSKNGIDFADLKHIDKNVLLLLNINNISQRNMLAEYNLTNFDIILDGEMYIEGEKLQTISSAVRKYNVNTQRLVFHIFDLAIPNLTQNVRLVLLKKLFNYFEENYGVDYTTIQRVSTSIISSNIEAIKYAKEKINAGYEGAIFRDKFAKYQFGKRPKTMVKYKERDSNEFLIINIVDTEKNPGIPVFICENDINDETFDCVIEGTATERREYFENKQQYIGKKLTVEYYERTSKGVPFHAIGITVRDYE